MQEVLTEAQKQEELLKRRQFLTKLGGASLAAAATLVIPTKANALIPNATTANPKLLDNTSGDTAAQIVTAALIAEDLATTFYYNGLVGKVIQDPALAGPGGSVLNPSPSGNPGNINYLQAALYEEVQHANFLRSVLGGTSYASDPVQTFYLPTGTFDTLASFTGVLDALESAFIGAYLAATLEFAQMAADSRGSGVRQQTGAGGNFSSTQLEYFSQVSAAILGVECEHRVLGRVISNSNPANQFSYEQQDGITSVYNGSASAVAALTPFLAPASGMTGYSLRTALASVPQLAIKTSGGLPPAPRARPDGQ